MYCSRVAFIQFAKVTFDDANDANGSRLKTLLLACISNGFCYLGQKLISILTVAQFSFFGCAACEFTIRLNLGEHLKSHRLSINSTSVY